MHILVLTSRRKQFLRIKQVVEQEGGSVARAGNLADARQSLRSQRVDAVVFDWSPEYETLPETVRTTSQSGDCRSLALVEHPVEEARAVAAAGTDDWVASDAPTEEVQSRLLTLIYRTVRRSLPATTEQRQVRRRQILRWAGRILLVVAGLLAAVANVAWWQERILEDEDRFVATLRPLIQDANVQTYLAQSVSARVTEAIDMPRLLAEQLPADLKLLSLPISTAADELLFSASRRAIESVASSPDLDPVLRKLHAGLTEIVENRNRAIVIEQQRLIVDFYQVAARVLEEFGSGNGQTILQQLEIPISADAGRFVVTTRAEFVTAWWLIENFRNLTAAVTVAALIAFGLVIGVARDRRRALVAVGATLAISILLTCILVGLLRSQVLNGIGDPARRLTSEATLRVLLQSFQAQSATAILAGLGLMLFGLAASNREFKLAIQKLMTAEAEDEGAALVAWVRYRMLGLRALGLGLSAALLIVWPDMSGRGLVTVLAFTGSYLLLLAVVASDASWAAAARTGTFRLWQRYVMGSTRRRETESAADWVVARAAVFRILGILLAVATLVLWPELSATTAIQIVAVLLLYLAGIDLLVRQRRWAA